MILNSLYKIEVYTDEFKQPVLPKIAKVRYVTIFKENEVGIKKQYQEYSENGWEKHSKKSIIRYYKAVEEFREQEHPREDSGKFTTKGGGSSDNEKLKSDIDDVMKKAWSLGKDGKVRRIGVGDDTLGAGLSSEYITNEPNPKFKVHPSPEFVSKGVGSLDDTRLGEQTAYGMMVSAFNKKYEFGRTTTVVSNDKYEFNRKKYWIESNKSMQVKEDYERNYETREDIYFYKPQWQYRITLHKSKRNPKTHSEYFTQDRVDQSIKRLRELEKYNNITELENLSDVMLIGTKGIDVLGNVAGAIADELEYLKNNNAEATEEFMEEDHPRDHGKFTTKGGGNKGDFKAKLKDRIKPNNKVKAIQKEVDEEITGKVWNTIDELGVRDKIKDVAMQGSYEKGTDLPTSGSDLDIFVIFNTDVSKDERERLGVQIGMKSLGGKNPYIQDATSKYAEAVFDHKGQRMEVQIVSTRHLTLDQIKNKEVNGKKIDIGMERTPHQTAFMKKALKGKEEEVRILKQFMKDTGLYDSSMKSQGFSGYATEVLIHNLGSFENVIKFFANFKIGEVIGGEKGSKDNIFSLIDPVDPNRDLISAFSPKKIGRTIKTAQHFLEHGKPPKKSEPIEMKSVTVSYDTTQFNEDTLAGQIRKTQNSMISQLNNLGFEIPSKTENIIKGFSVEIPRISSNKEEGESKVSLTFGMDKLTIPETYKDKGVPLGMTDAVSDYRKANKNRKFVEEDGRLKAIKKRPFTHLADAVRYLTTNGINLLQKTGVTNDMQGGITTSISKSKFENLI